ncbi:phage holin family protein [Nocardioides aurantiacus]|uniref:Putative membrane protein n=1 Tax=Nocardioides aurantiacus TaxID=86796 RepID=A0A3N2CZ68_9ACTN|nr:phage holin family protein [Nocardioides aurantiacus]ROR92753.1 putative membrane protein [Nocardioides aurantiacus]
MRFLVFVIANALALGAAVWLFEGITLPAPDDTTLAVELLVVGVIFGVVNAVVRPVVRLLSLPLIVLTLGLFWFVVNAAMLLLTSAISGAVGLDFRVDGFGTALLGSIVISLVSLLVNAVLPDPERRR